MKIKTITLIQPPGSVSYKVEKVTDSTEYRPGQVLDRNEVEGLCLSKAWKVTIK